MTYSELAEEVKSVERVEKRFEAVAYVLTNLGFTICSDPKPTNLERLEEIQNDWLRESRNGELFIEYLDRMGAKAPGDDGEH